MDAYRRGHFRAAIEHFKEADRLAPSPRLSFNVALSYERMADAPNALAAYRDYLRRAPEAANVQTTSVRIAELELELQKSGVQQLSVLSHPAGANVLIDDLSRGVTPWTGELPPGPHRLLLRARGYADTVRSFELPVRHAIDLIYSLEPVAGAPVGVAPVAGAPVGDAPGAGAPVAVAPDAGAPVAVAPLEPAQAALVAPEVVAPAPEVVAPASGIVTPAPAVVTPALPPVAAATTSLSALPPAAQERAEVRWWTWAVLGGSAGALIGAGAFELSRRHLETELDGGTDLVQPDVPDAYDTMLSRRTASRVFLGTGLVLGALGGVSLYFDLRRKEGGTDVGIACAAGECTAFTRGYW